MKRESRLSGVDVFLRPDKEEPLSIEADIDPDLKLLVTVGDLGEETLEATLLRLLRPEDETDDDGDDSLTEGFRMDSALLLLLLLSARADKRGTGAFGVKEGRDALLVSVMLLLTGSETEGATFLVFVEAPFSGRLGTAVSRFSATAPVLFLLKSEGMVVLEVVVCLVRVGFDLMELESGTLAPFPGTLAFGATPLGFEDLNEDFKPSAERIGVFLDTAEEFAIFVVSSL